MTLIKHSLLVEQVVKNQISRNRHSSKFGYLGIEDFQFVVESDRISPKPDPLILKKKHSFSYHVFVAQQVERTAVNRDVEGSSPSEDVLSII